MRLEIDEGYWGHRKTLRLCSLTQNAEADTYPPRLWAWAVRSAPRGNLNGMTPNEIEFAVRYRKLDGKLYCAMVTAGFIDEAAPGQPLEIHGWMQRTGAAILEMEKAAEKKRLYRSHKNRECVQPCEFCENGIPQGDDRPGRNRPRPKTVPGPSMDASEDSPGTVLGSSAERLTQTRTDQNRQEQTRSDPEGEPARARDARSVPDADLASARSGYQWGCSYGLEWREKYQRHYGNGSSDAKAQGDLTAILADLPDAEVLALWSSRGEMFQNYLGSTDQKLVGSRHPFALLVSRWCDFRADMPAPQVAAKAGGPPGIHYPEIPVRPEIPVDQRITDEERDELLREKWPEMHAKVQARKAMRAAADKSTTESA